MKNMSNCLKHIVVHTTKGSVGIVHVKISVTVRRMEMLAKEMKVEHGLRYQRY